MPSPSEKPYINLKVCESKWPPLAEGFKRPVSILFSPSLRSGSWDASDTVRCAESSLTFQKVVGKTQLGRAGLGYSKVEDSCRTFLFLMWQRNLYHSPHFRRMQKISVTRTVHIQTRLCLKDLSDTLKSFLCNITPCPKPGEKLLPTKPNTLVYSTFLPIGCCVLTWKKTLFFLSMFLSLN